MPQIWTKIGGLAMDKKKVLIVDDEVDIVDTIKFSLECEGIECIEAHDGEEALAKARKENPALISSGYHVAQDAWL